MTRVALAALAWLTLLALPAFGRDLRVLTYNVESDHDTQVDLVATDIARLAIGADIMVLTEVESPAAADMFAKAATEGSGRTFAVSAVGRTGGSDRIVILHATDRVRGIRSFELARSYTAACGYKSDPYFRGTLVVEFEDTDLGGRFWVSGSHFQRDPAFNACQARVLAAFIGRNHIAHIAAGDFNFDWRVPATPGAQTTHRPGLATLTAPGGSLWIKPRTILPTHCQVGEILDFHFVAHRARTWPARSEVLFAGDTECARDTEGYSDHRPVLATFRID